MSKSKLKTPGRSVANVQKEKAGLPANFMQQMRRQSGHGMEKVTTDDLIIPRLTIIQGMSRQIQKTKPEYIKGAKVGDIVDTATQKLYEEVHFLPVFYDVVWMEWAPRGEDVSLVRIHTDKSALDDCEQDDDTKQWVNQAGNSIVKTAQMYGLNLSDGGRQSFISLSKTQFKKAKQWMTWATSEVAEDDDGEFTPPLYFRTYKLTVKEESNKAGEWIGWVIERDVALNKLKNAADLYARAMAFREAVMTGMAKADTRADDIDRSSGDGAM